MKKQQASPGRNSNNKSMNKNASHVTNAVTPQFFLYTRLNENETKSLRKAESNRDEKKVLAKIFGLKSILNVTPLESPTKVD